MKTYEVQVSPRYPNTPPAPAAVYPDAANRQQAVVEACKILRLLGFFAGDYDLKVKGQGK